VCNILQFLLRSVVFHRIHGVCTAITGYFQHEELFRLLRYVNFECPSMFNSKPMRVYYIGSYNGQMWCWSERNRKYLHACLTALRTRWIFTRVSYRTTDTLNIYTRVLTHYGHAEYLHACLTTLRTRWIFIRMSYLTTDTLNIYTRVLLHYGHAEYLSWRGVSKLFVTL
jgi:hypothetical protein